MIPLALVAIGFFAMIAFTTWAVDNHDAALAKAGLQQCRVGSGWNQTVLWQKECPATQKGE